MTSDAQASGVAFLCDDQGKILKIVRDELGLADWIVPGKWLGIVVERQSLGKMLNFMVELRSRGTAFDWQLNVPIAGQIIDLNFAGATFDDKLLILAAKTRDGVMQLYEELAQINNEASPE